MDDFARGLRFLFPNCGAMERNLYVGENVF